MLVLKTQSAPLQGAHKVCKAVKLFFILFAVCQGEVREDTLDFQIRQLRHSENFLTICFAGNLSETVQSGINLEMYSGNCVLLFGISAEQPGLIIGKYGLRDMVFDNIVKILIRCVSENKYRVIRIHGSKFHCFAQRGDSQICGTGVHQSSGNPNGTVAVCVCFDHSHYRHVRTVHFTDLQKVVIEFLQIDLDDSVTICSDCFHMDISSFLKMQYEINRNRLL